MSLVGSLSAPRPPRATFACLVASRLSTGRLPARRSTGSATGRALRVRRSKAGHVDLISQVTLMGGACDRAAIVTLRGRNEVDRALRDGTLLRTARGRYALPTSPEFVCRASAFAGVLSHRSAAQYYGWAQKNLPSRPEITVARDRRISVAARKPVLPHWSNLPPEHVDGIVTTRERTLIDCMRNLPLDESIPIGDSAIRCDDFTAPEAANPGRRDTGSRAGADSFGGKSRHEQGG